MNRLKTAARLAAALLMLAGLLSSYTLILSAGVVVSAVVWPLGFVRALAERAHTAGRVAGYRVALKPPAPPAPADE
jgi:hypothetical protein